MDKGPGISLCSLTGYETHTLPGRSVLVIQEFVLSEEELQTGARHRLPLAMTASQANELAAALLRAATATEMGPAPSTNRN